jgi:hypothetical protein
MKTAMQELKDWSNQYKGQMISADQVVLQAHKLLEKEEEQIREAYILGHYDSSLDIYNPSECYSEIKNQNK